MYTSLVFCVGLLWSRDSLDPAEFSDIRVGRWGKITVGLVSVTWWIGRCESEGDIVVEEKLEEKMCEGRGVCPPFGLPQMACIATELIW